MALAFGITSSVLRSGSFINGPTMEHLANSYSVGASFMVGFGLCLLSLIMGICLVLVDSYASRKDQVVKTAATQESTFRARDLREFGFPFWLCIASTVTYFATTFVYVANAEYLLNENFGFSEPKSALYYTIPYFIAAVGAPFTGLLVDRVGSRPIFSKSLLYI